MRWLGLVVALGGILVGCGGSASTSSVVLRSKNPVAPNLYIQVRGPSGLVEALTRGMVRGKDNGGRFVVVAAPKGQKDCSRTGQINASDATAAIVKQFAGQKVTFVEYGAPDLCKGGEYLDPSKLR